MKKIKYLIASFSVLLLLIPSGVFADGDPEPEEDPESNLGYVDPYAFYQYGDTSELDSYFYNNYILLPYLESDGNQYIDTGIIGSSNLKSDIYFSDLKSFSNENNFYGIFGSDSGNDDRYYFYRTISSDPVNRYGFGSGIYNYIFELSDYNIYHICLDQNDCYFNDDLIYSLPSSSFLGRNSIYLLNIHSNSATNYYSKCKVYYFSIYDYSADSGNGALVMSLYPARSKANGTYGLYDSVSKVLYTSGNVGNPFENPQGSDAELGLMSRIQLFIGSSVSNIGRILYFAAAQPMILFFLAIGLAGVAIRWARRVVHL